MGIHVATQSKPPRQQYPSEGNLQISEEDEQCENGPWGESGGCWNLDGNPLAANSLQSLPEWALGEGTQPRQGGVRVQVPCQRHLVPRSLKANSQTTERNHQQYLNGGGDT